jgi:hypothetical protein
VPHFLERLFWWGTFDPKTVALNAKRRFHHPMPSLTRGSNLDSREEAWLIFYGDVKVGAIGRRSGNPVGTDSWFWRCGFYPVSNPGECTSGTATDFPEARATFERAWVVFSARRTEADFEAWRRDRASTDWKYAMWDAGCKLPTQVTDGRARCFCGAAITIADVNQHIYAAHMERKAA